jgi:DNA/RNA endonuclease YhcR with UshA esterase domain
MRIRVGSRWSSLVFWLVVSRATGLLAADAPQSISAAEAAAHLGQVKSVCGQVVSTKFAESSNRTPTFLNLDRPYPNQLFTAVIWGDDRPKFKDAPEDAFRGKRICVTGAIQLYKGRPEIIVSDPAQIAQPVGAH